MRKYLICAAAGLVVVLLAALYMMGWGLKASTGSSSQAEKASAPAAQGSHASHGTPPQPSPAAETAPVQAEAPVVEIPPEKQQLIGVKKAAVEVRMLQRTIRTSGKIEVDERRLKTVNAKVEGWIERLYVDFAGRYVRKGEPLAELYSPELVATQQELVNLLKWGRAPSGAAGEMIRRDAEALVEAARQRLRRFDISEAQIREIEQSGQIRRTLTITSPVAGYVIQKTALQGMKVAAGEKLFDIADLSTVWVVADIYEYELSSLKVGDPATIRLSYLPGKEFRSKIDYLYPTLSGETRTAKARFSIPNDGGRLKPQMFASVEIVVALGRKLSLPADAVIETGTRAVVYVDRGDGYFEPREVALGARGEGYREVLKGLKEGEKIAASAAFLVDSEAQIRGVKPLEKK